ncbi:hypothetical protein VE01_10263 [Pseudogymnoascus verrucosus]|uniref:Inner centromere protein ARK-binding domain-containing protein n=1 Tax=Pseudogymnoascus verrucosus TaxID=342668 RepID=A0A1B8G787_9PEZI|nr:uncharacterized protein VE01_10263 [Pseudogymnoascus verrucosus]OBT91698.2 hypothetical protein VE01_10263 [Pseudogymnoascus verrucosus]
MATGRLTTRLQVGSAAWVAEERSSAVQIADAEVEEFTFSARNELDWLNEHMAEIFNENQMNVTEMFKTPGKLRGKTPRTARKRNPLEVRAPLSDIFSASPRQNGNGSPLRQVYNERQAPKFKVAEDLPVPQADFAVPPKPARAGNNIFQDSGYHGSQSTQAAASMVFESQEATQEATQPFTQPWSPSRTPAKANLLSVVDDVQSEERRTTEGSYESAKEEQTMQVAMEKVATDTAPTPKQPLEMNFDSPEQARPESPELKSQETAAPALLEKELPQLPGTEQKEAEVFDEAATPSDGSSPVRQIVRKSSLSFAALPAREPLTTKKSMGNRPSHLEQNRTSYYGRGNDDRGFGNEEEDEMDVDAAEPAAEPASKAAQAFNKTYTQRLQDQISMLGQSKPNAPRPSKSIPNIAAMAAQQQESRPAASPSRTERAFNAPGAFPEDEDSWIGPPTTAAPSKSFSPRPALTKSYTTEVMEDIRGKESIGGHEFNVPKQRETRQPSPLREVAQHRPNGLFGHAKSQSTSVIRSPNKAHDDKELLKKTISVSNPNPGGEQSPPKSPTKSYRESPLKAAKDKLSSILKTSKGLFASSAAASADAMASTLSPPPGRMAYQASRSMADLMESTHATSIYPSLKTQPSSQSLIPESPSKKATIRKAKEKEVRDAEVMVQQLNKLDREREKEAEKARLFTQQERERVAAMERKVAAQKELKEQERRAAAQKEEERRLAAQKEEDRRIAAQQEQERLAAIQKEEERKALEREALAREAPVPRATRTSPRKTKAQLEAEGKAAAAAAEYADENVEMTEASSIPQSLSRSQIGRPKEPVKRPLRPTAKQPPTNSRGAPVVIRVNTGSRPFQPSNAALAASLGDSLPPAAPQPVAGPSRAKQPVRGLHPKASVDSLKSVSSSTTTKVKALEAAARKREQDEREAQRKRDAKAELTSQLESKRNAQRALEKKQELEKAKLNRPPPPPARPNPHADKPLPATHRAAEPEPVHRMNPTMQRPQEESRMNTLQNTTKAPPKRPMPADEAQSRPTMPRNGPSYHQNDSKRRKTEDEFLDDAMETQPRGAMAPPIRQSTIRQKDIPMKSLFPTGYSAAPSSHTTVHNAIPQHMQSKPTRPMDMTQTSKAPINFAPNPAHKTPARPLGPGHPNGKSTSKPSAKSSPRYMNGENIELPEIHTDSEDEDSDAGGDFAVPEWANSPNLAAGIMAQEGCDPTSVFGAPGELRMEEVFRNKERWGKFRQRTSSANWSGTDRLTEEEIQRDLVARERLRREGGWTYGMS